MGGSNICGGGSSGAPGPELPVPRHQYGSWVTHQLRFAI
jgi:hypothetical protein